MRSAIRAVVAAAVTAIVACDGPTAPNADATGSVAGLAKTSPCPGNSGGDCDMTVSVLTTPTGPATLIVRTGGVDESTGAYTPNGTFEKIQYKIYNEKGKLVSTTNDNGATGTFYRASLPSGFQSTYSVDVQANIANHSGKNGMAVVRGTGTPVAAPDIDLAAQSIKQLVNAQRLPIVPVPEGSTNTYVVDFVNGSATGVLATCVVTVDGVAQPNSTPIYLAAHQTKACQFSLTLSAGTHDVKVAAVIDPAYIDANPANNSVTAKIVARPPADIAVSGIARIVNGAPATPTGDVLAGTSPAFKATVVSPAGSLNANVTCSVLMDGAAIPDNRLHWTQQTFALAGGANNTCDFTVDFPNAGSFNLKVVATAAGDPNPANNAASETITVRSAADPSVTTDLVVRSITPNNVVLSGSDQEYVAKVGVNATPGITLTTPEFTCSVSVARTSGKPVTATVLWAKQNGGVTITGDDECRFRLVGLVSNDDADDTYHISVTATATNANELPGKSADNTLAIDQLVRAINVDLDVVGLQRSNPVVGGQPWVPVDSVLAGPSFTYRAFVGTVAGGATLTSANFNCSVEVSAPGFVTQTIPGTPAGPATTAGSATCSFPLALQGNGNDDRSYSIKVSVTPTGGSEFALANNSETFTQLAIVRSDIGVLVDRINLTDGTNVHPCTVTSGLCSLVKSDTISVGKTGNFTAWLHNYSANSTLVNCQVTAAPPGNPQAPLTVVPAQMQIGAGGEVSCAFSYTFAERVAVDFTVIATAVSPKDNQRANDTVRFNMAPVQNIKFPNLEFANVVADERGLQSGADVTDLYAQQASLSRVFLAFTNKTAVIGDFTFTGKVFTNGATTPMTQGVFRVTGLRPGGLGLARNCVGMGGEGATVISASGANDPFVDMQICAEESPSDPNTQMISVTYTATMEGTHTGTSLVNFGPTVLFDLRLEWVLAGNLPSQVSTATGKLQFDVARTDLGGGAYRKNQVGTVTIVP